MTNSNLEVLLWIVGSGLLMSAIALVGSVTLVLDEQTLKRMLLPLVPFAAGNFIYIAASDLIPEIKAHANFRANAIHFAAFVVGMALMLLVTVALEP